VPSRLQLLVVFWSTGAAAICLMQALIAGDPLTLVPALVLSLAACLGRSVGSCLPTRHGRHGRPDRPRVRHGIEEYLRVLINTRREPQAHTWYVAFR
jgi:hypothetical protein